MARVLLVEDDIALREAERVAIAGHGHDVATAADGEEALRRLDRDPSSCDVLVVDLEIPKLGGVDLLAALRRRLVCAAIPIVLVSAWVPSVRIPGVAVALQKPARAEDVAAAVDAAAASVGAR